MKQTPATAGTVEREGSVIPSNCRIGLIWTHDIQQVQSILRVCDGLRRLYVITDKHFAGHGLIDDRVCIIPIGPDALTQTLSPCFERDLQFFVEGRVGLYVAGHICDTHKQTVADIKQLLLKFTQTVISSMALRATRGWHILGNALLNLPRACREHAISELQHTLKKKPVVIVGAGPSLDKNIHVLKQYQPYVHIIACDAACTTFAQHDMEPDLIITTDDSEKIWRYFAALHGAFDHIPVACMVTSSWPLIRHHPAPLFFGRRRTTSGRILSHAVPTIQPFEAGLCVGHAAMELAALMGADPIIMMGFDLGYAGDRFHPEHQPMPYFHDHPPLEENLLTIPGNNGIDVLTDLSMSLYLQEFEKRINTLDRTVFNCTEGGARISGTHVATLKSVLGEITDHKITKKSLLSHHPDTASQNAIKPVLDRWTDQSEALVNHIKHLIQNNQCVPIDGGPVPFPFLNRYREVVELISDTENLTQSATFKFAWEDWMKTPGHTKQQIIPIAQRYLQEIRSNAEIISVFLRMQPIYQQQRNNKIAIFQDTDIAPMSSLHTRLQTVLQTVIEFYHCDLSHLPEIWNTILDNQISLAISINGSLFPAAWAMPGLACIDVWTQSPHSNIIVEQWLPGYAVICMDKTLAEQWRQRIPIDRPVCLWTQDGLIELGGKHFDCHYLANTGK